MVIKHHFEGAPKVSYFDFETEALSLSVEPGRDDIIVKNLFISVDPYQINCMKIKSPSLSSISAAMRINPGEVALLKEKQGFDDAFNYKEETDLDSTLKRYFPHGIDIYFDNVGGEMLEAAVANMKAFGRVTACGVISEYIDAGKRSSPNMLEVEYKRITIRGFLVFDYVNLIANFLAKTIEYLCAGKLKVIEDISLGMESIPSAFIELFNGANIGNCENSSRVIKE